MIYRQTSSKKLSFYILIADKTDFSQTNSMFYFDVGNAVFAKIPISVVITWHATHESGNIEILLSAFMSLHFTNKAISLAVLKYFFAACILVKCKLTFHFFRTYFSIFALLRL